MHHHNTCAASFSVESIPQSSLPSSRRIVLGLLGPGCYRFSLSKSATSIFSFRIVSEGLWYDHYLCVLGVLQSDYDAENAGGISWKFKCTMSKTQDYFLPHNTDGWEHKKYSIIREAVAYIIQKVIGFNKNCCQFSDLAEAMNNIAGLSNCSDLVLFAENCMKCAFKNGGLTEYIVTAGRTILPISAVYSMYGLVTDWDCTGEARVSVSMMFVCSATWMMQQRGQQR